MAEFKVNPEYCWSDGKGLVDLSKDIAGKKTVKKSRKVAEVPATPTRRSARVRNKHRAEDAVPEQMEEEAPEMEVI